MLESGLFVAGTASVGAITSLWVVSVSFLIVSVMVVAGCACCKCQRKMKGMEDEAPYERAGGGPGVVTLNYHSRASPQKHLEPTGPSSVVVHNQDGRQPNAPSVHHQQQQPLLPDAGNAAKRPTSINRALPKLPDSGATDTNANTGSGKMGKNFGAGSSEQMSPLTRDSSISEMYATVDKPSSPSAGRPVPLASLTREYLVRPQNNDEPGSGGYRSVITTNTPSSTTRVVVDDARNQRTSPKEDVPDSSPRHLYAQIPPLRDRLSSSDNAQLQKTNQQNPPPVPLDAHPVVGSRRGSGTPDRNSAPVGSPNGTSVIPDRHQYEYPMFPGRNGNGTATVHPGANRYQDPKLPSQSTRPLVENDNQTSQKPDALYSGSTGSEDPYSSIASNVEDYARIPATSTDEPWYAKVDEMRRPQTSSSDAKTVGSSDRFGQTHTPNDNGAAPSYSMINKTSSSRIDPIPTDTRNGTGDLPPGLPARDSTSRGSSVPPIEHPNGERLDQPQIPSGDNDNLAESTSANGPKREPSYRYITVRESLDVLRERMAAQARDQENMAWRAAGQDAYQQDPQAHYYSTIGSDNGYETVPGNETPQHLYEDISQLNARTTEQVHQPGSSEQEEQESGYAYVTGSFELEHPASSDTAAIHHDLRRPPSTTRSSIIDEMTPPRPPTSPIPGRTDGIGVPSGRQSSVSTTESRPMSVDSSTIISPPESSRTADENADDSMLIHGKQTVNDSDRLDRSLSLSDHDGDQTSVTDNGNSVDLLNYQEWQEPFNSTDPGYETIREPVTRPDRTKPTSDWKTDNKKSGGARIVKPTVTSVLDKKPPINAVTNWDGKRVQRPGSSPEHQESQPTFIADSPSVHARTSTPKSGTKGKTAPGSSPTSGAQGKPGSHPTTGAPLGAAQGRTVPGSDSNTGTPPGTAQGRTVPGSHPITGTPSGGAQGSTVPGSHPNTGAPPGAAQGRTVPGSQPMAGSPSGGAQDRTVPGSHPNTSTPPGAAQGRTVAGSHPITGTPSSGAQGRIVPGSHPNTGTPPGTAQGRTVPGSQSITCTSPGGAQSRTVPGSHPITTTPRRPLDESSSPTASPHKTPASPSKSPAGISRVDGSPITGVSKSPKTVSIHDTVSPDTPYGHKSGGRVQHSPPSARRQSPAKTPAEQFGRVETVATVDTSTPRGYRTSPTRSRRSPITEYTSPTSAIPPLEYYVKRGIPQSTYHSVRAETKDVGHPRTGSPRDSPTRYLPSKLDESNGFDGRMHSSPTRHAKSQSPSVRSESPSKSIGRGTYSETASSFTGSPTRSFVSAYQPPPEGLISKESLSIEIYGRNPNSPDSCFASLPSSSPYSPPSDGRRTPYSINSTAGTVTPTSGRGTASATPTSSFVPFYGGGGGGGGDSGTPKTHATPPTTTQTTPMATAQDPVITPSARMPSMIPMTKYEPNEFFPAFDDAGNVAVIQPKRPPKPQPPPPTPSNSDFHDPIRTHEKCKKSASGGDGAEGACFCHGCGGDTSDMRATVLTHNLYHIDNAQIIPLQNPLAV